MKRDYLIDVSPSHPFKFDEGLSLRVQVSASSRKHAISILRRYIKGTITGIKLLRQV